MSKNELTIKQEKFALEYILTGNASEAYRRAYDAENMLNRTINRKATDLLKHEKVSSKIAELKKEMVKKYEVKRDYILKSLVENMEIAKNEGVLSEVRQNAQAICKMEGFDKLKDNVPAEVRVVIDYP